MSWNLPQPKPYYDLKRSKKRITIFQGGSSSGKTYSILQGLIEFAYQNRARQKCIWTIVRATLPALKKSALMDFENILNKYNIPFKRNKTELTYEVFNTTFQFMAIDDPQKARGPRRYGLFINEANEISFEKYRQLALRTTQKIILDFNPSEEFYVHTDLLGNPQVDFYKSNYTHNPFLNQYQIEEIEQYKLLDDDNFWKVFGLGEIGTIQGQIYPNFQTIDSFPDQLENFGYGLDFGFSNSPTALVQCGIQKNNLYLHELIYQTQLTNLDSDPTRPSIDGLMKKNGVSRNHLIVADSEDPKSIHDLAYAGWMIEPAKKGADSLSFGINKVKEFNIFVTADSLNLIKELKNYKFKKDPFSEKFLNVPVKSFDHGMDAMRYYILNTINETNLQAAII